MPPRPQSIAGTGDMVMVMINQKPKQNNKQFQLTKRSYSHQKTAIENFVYVSAPLNIFFIGRNALIVFGHVSFGNLRKMNSRGGYFLNIPPKCHRMASVLAS